jgi:hypothetical protein
LLISCSLMFPSFSGRNSDDIRLQIFIHTFRKDVSCEWKETSNDFDEFYWRQYDKWWVSREMTINWWSYGVIDCWRNLGMHIFGPVKKSTLTSRLRPNCTKRISLQIHRTWHRNKEK